MFPLIHKSRVPYLSEVVNHSEVLVSYIPQHWESKNLPAQHTQSTPHASLGVEGGRKCFLTSCLSTKNEMISEDEVMMLHPCLNAPPPSVPTSPTCTQQAPAYPAHSSCGPCRPLLIIPLRPSPSIPRPVRPTGSPSCFRPLVIDKDASCSIRHPTLNLLPSGGWGCREEGRVCKRRRW